MHVTLLGDLWLIEASVIKLPKMNQDTNLLIANLETPVSPDNASPRPKIGPSLKGNLNTLSLLSNNYTNLCLSLANNHTMDFGEEGLWETLNACKRLEIATFGAGSDLQGACASIIKEINGVRIGILGCCETQFGIATLQRAGVAPLSPSIYDAIRELALNTDIVIVSIHGAAEYCPWPSPHWQDLLRSFVDTGARIVHGHHAHVPQGYEEYHDGIIFYGLGNLLIDPDGWQDHPNASWSVVSNCSFSTDGLEFSIGTIVIEREKSSVSVRWSTEQEFLGHSDYLSKCNSPLENRLLLTGLWQEAALRMYDLWYGDWFGGHPTRQKRKISARTRLSFLKRGIQRAARGFDPPSREQERLWYHAFSCESHVDVISTALGVLSGELDDLRTDEICRLVDEMMPWSIESVTSMKWPGV